MEATPGGWGVSCWGRGCLCLSPTPGSHLKEDHREIHVDAGRGGRWWIQLHDALRNQVLMHPPRLGPLLPVLGDDCLLVELVSQIPILALEHGAAAREYEGGYGSASRSHQSLLSDRASGPPPRRRATGPELWSRGRPCQGRRHSGPRRNFAVTGPPPVGAAAAAAAAAAFRRLPKSFLTIDNNI